jgi:hypothetical protein
MSFRSLRTFIGLAVATSGVLVLALPVSASGEPVPATGSLVITSAVFTSTRDADGNKIVTANLTGNISGTFSGTFTEDVREVIHFTGDANLKGTAVCTCSVSGVGAGSVLIGFDAIGEPSGALSGRFEILSATGGLSGLVGQGTFSSPNGFNATYSGQIHS